MCRNIQTLFNFEPSATEDEVRTAALQYEAAGRRARAEKRFATA